MAGTVTETQLPEAVRSVGKALSGVSGAAPWFEEQGLAADASQLERLQALAKANIDTMEELTAIGIKEDVQRRNLERLVPLTREVETTRAEIFQKAKPGLFVRERREIEQEMPWMAQARAIDVMKASQEAEQALGPRKEEALHLELFERAKYLAIQRTGAEEMLLEPEEIEAKRVKRRRWRGMSYPAMEIMEAAGRPMGATVPAAEAPPAADGKEFGATAGGLISSMMEKVFGAHFAPGDQVTTTAAAAPRTLSPGLSLDR
jgi:hypothetical protein